MSHRSSAREQLAYAEQALYETADTSTAITHALVSIAHSLVAMTERHCECGVERPIEHEDWCMFRGPDDQLQDAPDRLTDA